MRKLSFAMTSSLLLLCASAAGVAFLVSPLTGSSSLAYRQILSFSRQEAEDLTTRQERRNITKMHMQGGTDKRGVLDIHCETSTLYLKPSMGLGETMEEMTNVAAHWRPHREAPPLYNMFAEKAVFYPKLRHLTMEKVAAKREQSGMPSGIEVVHAGTAIFDGELLHLSDGVTAELDNMEISADKATLYPRRLDQRFEIEKIFLSGDVRVRSKKGNPPMELKANQIEWDLAKKNLFAKSSNGKQVHCEDGKTKVDGDTLEALIQQTNGTMQIEKLTIRGNVKLQSHNTPQPQFALAEFLEYTPLTHTWLLSSPPPKRVLYYDKMNSVTISAPNVIVKQPEGQQKPYVKASGDVKFVFGEKEISELQQRFQSHSSKKL